MLKAPLTGTPSYSERIVPISLVEGPSSTEFCRTYKRCEMFEVWQGDPFPLPLADEIIRKSCHCCAFTSDMVNVRVDVPYVERAKTPSFRESG